MFDIFAVFWFDEETSNICTGIASLGREIEKFLSVL